MKAAIKYLTKMMADPSNERQMSGKKASWYKMSSPLPRQWEINWPEIGHILYVEPVFRYDTSYDCAYTTTRQIVILISLSK